jgi:hypothetical protein
MIAKRFDLPGIIPDEHTSGERQHVGKTSKKGNPLLRFHWGETAIHEARQRRNLKHFRRSKPQQN